MATRSTLLTKNLTATAVYWGTPASDGYGGRTFADPMEINCRWEQKQELFIDATGQQQISRAVVYLDQDVDLGGYLYLGILDDLDSAPIPEDVAGSYEIRGFSSIPSLRGDMNKRKAWL